MRTVFKLLILFYCGYSTAATISYRQLSEDTFQLILSNDTPLEIDQAQSSIYNEAVQLCNGKNPLFGKYSFESSEPIAKDASAASFIFLQEIKCTDKAAATATPQKIELSKAQESTIKEAAKKITEEFLLAKESGDFKKAYNMLGPETKSITTFSVWKTRESDYSGENIGKLITRDIWRITLYNNPQNSPKPGLYIAADYENSYEKLPARCGYVIWYLPTKDSIDFSVMREEYGIITTNTLKKIPKEDLQTVRKKMGCRAL